MDSFKEFQKKENLITCIDYETFPNIQRLRCIRNTLAMSMHEMVTDVYLLHFSWTWNCTNIFFEYQSENTLKNFVSPMQIRDIMFIIH